MWVIKQQLVHTDFDSGKKNTMEVAMDQQLFGYPCLVLRSTEETNSGLKQLESE